MQAYQFGETEPQSDALPLYLRGLDAERVLVCENYPLKNVFAVVTWGCAATQWLARALNEHPEMYCVHAANYFWTKFGGAPHVDGMEYLRLLGTQGSAFSAAGDVHGVSLETIPAIRQAFGNRFGWAVVVREPIARLNSQFALYDRFAKFRSWNIDLSVNLADLGIRLPADTYENRLAVVGIANLNRIVGESATGASIFRSEDLTTSAHTLATLVDEVTRGTVMVDERWAASAVASSAVNSHVARQSKSSLEDWHVDAIRRIVTPQAWNLYASLGYPLPEFLSEGTPQRTGIFRTPEKPTAAVVERREVVSSSGDQRALRLNRPARAPLGRTLRGFSQKNHLEDLAEIAPDARIIFDVGTNKGETAEQFWHFFQQATVYCFEPAPRTFQFLESRARNIPRLVLENRAVSDIEGRLTFHQYGDHAANSLLPADPRAFSQIPVGIEETGTTDVDVVTLDSYCETHAIPSIDILKFDIQGNELRALKGAHRLLASKKIRAIYTEVLFIPVYTGQGEFHEIQSLLQGYGYGLFDFYSFSYGANGQLRWGDALFLPTP